jgi:hypothetical protein
MKIFACNQLIKVLVQSAKSLVNKGGKGNFQRMFGNVWQTILTKKKLFY